MVERDTPAQTGQQGSGFPLEVGMWKPGGAGRQTQLFAGQRSESSALGGSNSHPREPPFREAVIHLQVLGTKQLCGAEPVTCALGHTPSKLASAAALSHAGRQALVCLPKL